MIKSGRALRLGRLFKGDETPLFLVPLDHTVTDGPFTDARGYDALLGILADNGADAIVVHKGRLRLLPRSVYARLAVVVHLSASTRYAADPTFKYQVAEVEDCLRRGADAVSVHVNVGSLTEDRQLRDMAGVADACDRAGLPLLAMLYPRGPGIKDHPQLETLLHAAALAVDLGADIVKLPLQGPVAAMKRVVDSCPIPILAAGGAQVSDHQFGAFVADVMASGARGLAAGRNIFMAADPAAKVREVRQLLSAAVAFNRADTPPLADAAGDQWHSRPTVAQPPRSTFDDDGVDRYTRLQRRRDTRHHIGGRGASDRRRDLRWRGRRHARGSSRRRAMGCIQERRRPGQNRGRHLRALPQRRRVRPGGLASATQQEGWHPRRRREHGEPGGGLRRGPRRAVDRHSIQGPDQNSARDRAGRGLAPRRQDHDLRIGPVRGEGSHERPWSRVRTA